MCHIPIVILLAVDVSVPGEAGDLPVQGVPAVAALQAGRVPPPVHRLQVEPVCDPASTACTHGGGGGVVRVRRWRRRRPRRRGRLELGHVHVLERGGGRSADVVRAGRLVVVVVRGCAAGAAAGYARRFHVTH